MLYLMTETPERWEQSISGTDADGMLKDKKHLSYEEAREFARKGGYKIDMPTERHIEIEFDNFKDILPLFFRRRWLLLKAPKSSGGFITSDHPVVLVWSNPKERGGVYGPGLGLPGTDIYFPISPQLAVVGAFEITDSEKEISEDIVAGINGAQVAYAERQVYSRDMHFAYSLQPNEPSRKANKLVNDSRFRRPRHRLKEEPALD